MTTATDRLDSEQKFHDRQAAGRSGHFRDPASLRLRDEEYLDHETWVRPAFDQLRELAGKRVLDFGCGHGMASVVLARRGAHVTAFDTSPGYLQEARARAKVNEVDITFVQADGERLPFGDTAFDRIWGNAVLHHLNLSAAAKELRRVLAPGGIAVFCEPWGENPLLNFTRRYLPYPGKARTPDECPLRRRQVTPLRRLFTAVRVEGFQLVSMVRRVLPHGRFVAALDRCDEVLLRRVPCLQQFCRYVVLTLHR